MRKNILFFILVTSVFILNAQSDNTRQIKLLFVGDIMGHDSQIESAAIVENQLYDYSPCFEYVKPIIKEADLAIGNLEVTLPGKPPYTGYPTFKSPDELALDVRHAGFDMLVTSNNHSNDAGVDGVINTINTLDAYGFYHTGTFQSQEEKDAFYPYIVYKNGLKLVFVNYTYDTNGIPTRSPTIVNLIDKQKIEQDMAMARQLNPDMIIAIMHWGDEYQLVENETQRKLTQNLFNWGADLIIGAHPHVVQPIKEQKSVMPDGSTKKQVVAYSLGNFISGQRKKNTDGGLIFEVTIEKDLTTNKTSILSHTYIPVFRYIEKEKDEEGKEKITFRILPIAAFEERPKDQLSIPEESYKAMKNYAKTVRVQQAKYDSSERKISLQDITPKAEATNK